MGVYVGVVEHRSSGEDPDVYVGTSRHVVLAHMVSGLLAANVELEDVKFEYGEAVTVRTLGVPDFTDEQALVGWLARMRAATTVPWYSLYENEPVHDAIPKDGLPGHSDLESETHRGDGN